MNIRMMTLALSLVTATCSFGQFKTDAPPVAKSATAMTATSSQGHTPSNGSTATKSGKYTYARIGTIVTVEGENMIEKMDANRGMGNSMEAMANSGEKEMLQKLQSATKMNSIDEALNFMGQYGYKLQTVVSTTSERTTYRSYILMKENQ